MLRFPQGRSPLPSVRVTRILGKPGELGVDTEIIIRSITCRTISENRFLEEASSRRNRHETDFEA